MHTPKGAPTLKCLLSGRPLPRPVNRTYVVKPLFYNGFPNTPKDNVHGFVQDDINLILDSTRHRPLETNNEIADHIDPDTDNPQVYEEEIY